MGRFDEQIGARRDEVGANFADLQAQIDGSKEEIAVITATTVDVPVVDNTFTPIFTRGKKNKIIVTLRFANFGTARDIKVVMLPRAQILTSGNYDNLRITSHLTEEISDDVIAVQLVTSPLTALLEPETQYDIIRLVAIGADNTERAVNPTPDPVFASYPGNVLYTFTTPAIFNIPGSPAANLILVNRRDLSTKDVTDAEIVVRVHAPLTDAGAAQTWGAANVDEVVPVFQRLEGTPSAYPIDKESAYKLQGTDLTQVDSSGLSVPVNRGYVDIGKKGLAAGAPYSWLHNIAWSNGQKAISTGSAVNFRGANENDDPANLTSVSLTITSTALPPYDADAVEVKLNYTQPALVESLKHVKVERKLQSEADSEYKVVIPKFSLKDDQFNTASTSYSVVISGAGGLKTKPSKNYRLRTTITGIGGVQRIFTTDFSTGVDGAVLSDTTRPATPSAPICQPFIDGNVKVEADVPSDQFNTIKKYRYAMSTSNTAPDRDSPSVGVATVVALKKSNLFVMFQRALTDVSSITFYFRVQALNVIGWSEWSAATSVLGSDIGRPLTDVIGSGVADHSMGLLSASTAPGSPAVANDTTHYSISVADTTNYQTLITSGTIIHLHIPSLDPDDVIRKATAFDDTNNRFTVDVAFGSTPGNSLAYEIHYGNRLGEKSGTGHSTTVIDLGVAGAALANDTLLGHYIYMPSQPSGDEIRRIIDHTSGNVTMESATAGALPNNDCYLICEGTFGYAAINPLSGVIAAVPFRPYFDDETGQNRFDVVMPSGENVFSSRAVEFKGYKSGTGTHRTTDTFDVSVIPSYAIKAPDTYLPVYTMRIQNMYRDSGSDGWNSDTFYVEGYDTTSTPPTTYDPSAIPPVERDIFGEDNYPFSEFPTY